jgi:hypothetical protein
MDSNGVQFSGTPLVNQLSNGSFEMSVASGTIVTLASTVINTNANVTFSADRFATTSANTKGFNVTYTGPATGSNFWLFTGAYGNLAGESFDADGSNACGHIQWDDSICLQISQSHYRFRNDDGGEGAATSTWYNNSWSAREKIVINNPNATSTTNLPVQILLPYKSSMLANTNDLRFTDSSGTTSISYWREATISSGTTTVWVKIASLPSNGSATIYVYYGNPSASAADDTTGTFPFMDVFEDGDISDYTVASGDTGLFAASAGAGYANYSGSTYGLTGNATGHTTNGGIYKTGTITGQNKTIRFYESAANSSDEPCLLFGVQNPTNTHNYAACVEEFKNRISLAQDVKNNDNSG